MLVLISNTPVLSNKTLNAIYRVIILVKNKAGSTFISFACSNTIIGIQINIVASNIGIGRKVLYFFEGSKSFTISKIEIKLKNQPSTFK
jgi:hypothetical protein